MLGEPRSWVAHYLEQAKRFQLLAEMEIQPQARARLLELADDYQHLAEAKSRKPRDSSSKLSLE